MTQALILKIVRDVEALNRLLNYGKKQRAALGVSEEQLAKQLESVIKDTLESLERNPTESELEEAFWECHPAPSEEVLSLDNQETRIKNHKQLGSLQLELYLVKKHFNPSLTQPQVVTDYLVEMEQQRQERAKRSEKTAALKDNNRWLLIKEIVGLANLIAKQQVAAKNFQGDAAKRFFESIILLKNKLDALKGTLSTELTDDEIKTAYDMLPIKTVSLVDTASIIKSAPAVFVVPQKQTLPLVSSNSAQADATALGASFYLLALELYLQIAKFYIVSAFFYMTAQAKKNEITVTKMQTIQHVVDEFNKQSSAADISNYLTKEGKVVIIDGGHTKSIPMAASLLAHRYDADCGVGKSKATRTDETGTEKIFSKYGILLRAKL